MNILNITPYNKTEGGIYETLEVRINADSFVDVVERIGNAEYMFENCFFTSISVLNEKEVTFNKIHISFNYCAIRQIDVKSLVSKNISFSFHGCLIEANFNNEDIQSISFNNCILRRLFLINQRQVNISYTSENVFPKRWKKILEKTDVPNLSDLIALKQEIRVHDVQNLRLFLNRSKDVGKGFFINKIGVNDETILKYGVNESEIKKLNINVSIHCSIGLVPSVVKVNNCVLNSFSIGGNSNSNISIENCFINNLYIREFATEKEFLFFNIRPFKLDSRVEIHKSNLDNFWFDNVDFYQYDLVSLYRTRLAKASFYSCNFPEDNLSFEKFRALENVHYPEDVSQNYYKDQYEIFLQLKKSLESSGNYYEALKMDTISKESLRHVSSLSSWDRFILWLGSKSNNHGLSIKRPFIGLLVFSIGFYILYLLSIGRICIPCKVDYTLVGHYFSFLDLTHRKDFLISKEEYSFWTLTIDFVNKIFVSYFIYQFISAFRKYGKK